MGKENQKYKINKKENSQNRQTNKNSRLYTTIRWNTERSQLGMSGRAFKVQNKRSIAAIEQDSGQLQKH